MALMMNKTIRLDISALSLPPGVLSQDHPIIRAVSDTTRIQERNEIHYDTPDFKLRWDNMGLTLNREGDQWIQRFSVKNTYEHCKEWLETPTYNNRLDLKAFKPGKRSFFSQALLQLRQNADIVLAPVFTLHCREEQWSLNFPDDVRITLREERGYLKFGAARQPFHELVLEHQSGSLARWYQTALELAYDFFRDEKSGPSLACASPVTRGFAWLDPDFIMPMIRSGKGLRETACETADEKSSVGHFKLRENMTVRHAFVHICSGLLQRIQACRGIILYGGKQAKLDGVQHFYQATTQLHTLTLLCHALLPEEVRREMDSEIRWLLKELDLVREWQTFLKETLEPLIEQFTSYPGLEILRAKAKNGQQLSVERLAKTLTSFRYTRLILSMASWTSGNHWEFLSDLAQREGMAAPVTRFAVEMLQRYHEQLRKRGQRFPNMSLSARCGLRSDVDFLAHTTNLFSELFIKKRTPSFQNRLDSFQNNIHSLVDLHASSRFFARLVDKKEETMGHIIQEWQEARTKRRLFDSTKEWERFSSELPFW